MQVGDEVDVEAVSNTDGGRYAWRCTRVLPVLQAELAKQQLLNLQRAAAARPSSERHGAGFPPATFSRVKFFHASLAPLHIDTGLFSAHVP